MSELESVAYTCCSNTTSLHSSNSIADLGFLNTDAMSLAMDIDNVESSFSPATTESDVSTGYLEDALVEFTSKRRRLLFYPNSDDSYFHQNYTQPNPLHLLQSCWNTSYCSWDDVSENFNWMNQTYSMNYDALSADEPISTSPKSRISEEAKINLSPDMKTPDHYNEDPNSSSSSSKHTVNSQFLADKDTIFTLDRKPISGGGGGCDRKKEKEKEKKRVVYPFAMVKPGGVEGDITLKDINKRILMPPTRPVRHPVGEFACRPFISADGTGLSGKAVVTLTRIHTQGRRGTITIIRTKA